MNSASIKPHLHTRPGSTQGFTLLELLVVIVIIAILFSFTLLAIRSGSAEDLIEQEAQRFSRLLQLAQQEAVLRNTEYGIEFNARWYQFLLFSEQGWQPLESDRQLRKRELPADMELELSVEQTDIIIGEKEETDDADNESEELHKPQVFLLSSEEITPEFSVRFSFPGVENSYIVQGFIDGQQQISIDDL